MQWANDMDLSVGNTRTEQAGSVYIMISFIADCHLICLQAFLPLLTCNDCVIEDMKLAGLRREDAQDRVVWRSGILGKRQTRACVEKKTLKRL